MLPTFIIGMYLLVIMMLCGVSILVIYRSNNHQKHSSPDEFLGLLTILSSQIQSELDSYEKDIFENKGSITNNNFDRYYRDLTSRIIKNINPNMIKDLSYYYTEEAVYRFIGRSVRDYLVSKISGTL